MKEILIFGKEIKVKSYYCKLDEYEPQKIKEPYINIYVTITNKCNAKCKFCCNEKNRNFIKEFDFEKFKATMIEIRKNIRINKCSFTGGEPSLHIELLKNCLKFIKELDENIFTVINTNGFNLEKIQNLLPYINSVALSRHHYSDMVNENIFLNKQIPKEKDILNFSEKEKLHISCNLMKDYIGNTNQVIQFLEWVSTTGCEDVGFVSLMPINEFCKEQFVDFNDLKFDDIKDVFITKNWNYKNLCRCRNYIYLAQNGKMISVYARYYVDPSYNGNTLVFDGEHLKQGFNGNIIY